MNVSEFELLTHLKNNMVAFLQELSDRFPEETDFTLYRLLITKIPIVDVMEYIVNKLCPLQEMVKKRDEKFFLEYNVLFEHFDSNDTSKVEHFKKIWKSNALDAQDREIIWKWFTLFINLGNNYKKISNK